MSKIDNGVILQSTRRRRVLTHKPSFICCRTCRARRIRCDGHRPLCNKCFTSSRQCGGYNIQEVELLLSVSESTQEYDYPDRNEEHTAEQDKVLPKPSSMTGSTVPLNTITTSRPYITDDGRAAIDYFQVHCIAMMVQRSASPKTTREVFDFALSMARNDAMFFHTLVALAIARRGVIQATHTTHLIALDFTSVVQASEAMDKALSLSRQHIARSMAAPGALEKLIVIATLFSVFEATQGNWSRSKRHVLFAQAIIEANPQQCKGALPGTILASCIFTTLGVDTLGHFSAPTSTALADSSKGESEDLCASFVPHMLSSGKFSSLEEASMSLEIIMESTAEIRIEILRYTGERCARDLSWPGRLPLAVTQCLVHCRSHYVPMESKARLYERISAAEMSHALWKVAFDRLIADLPETQAARFLQITSFASIFALKMCRMNQETATDSFMLDFVHVLDLVERYLQVRSMLRRSSESEPEPSTRAVGIAEFGILPAIYLISLKCRHSTIRRRARDLLLFAQRREGGLESWSLASISTAIILLEEQKARDIDITASFTDNLTPSQIGEEARFGDVVVTPLPEGDSAFNIACGRVKHESGRAIEILEYTVKADRSLFSFDSSNHNREKAILENISKLKALHSFKNSVV